MSRSLMDAVPTREDNEYSPSTSGGRTEGTMWMWVWIIGFLVLVVLAARWMDHSRGSTGRSRADDLPGMKDGRPKRIDSGGGSPF